MATTGLALYSQTAARSAATVIARYSTSFGVASRLLGAGVRADVRNIYSLVRVADEIVDGAAGEAGLDIPEQRWMLAALEDETGRAVRSGYSANLVVHAFACTARSAGIDGALISPFFASMRRDLMPVAFTADELQEYIYGSAEVVGLMCLRVFLRGSETPDAQRVRLEEGARRLGSAFQKLNFLRDLSEDRDARGRNYFPGIDSGRLTECQKAALLDDIDADLRAAAETIPQLPRSARTAVSAAHDLFAALSCRMRRTPAAELVSTRVSVPGHSKLQLLVRALLARAPRSSA